MLRHAFRLFYRIPCTIHVVRFVCYSFFLCKTSCSSRFFCVIAGFITPRAHARSGVKQWVLSVSVSVSHQNIGLITTTKGLNTSKRHSNNDNSEKTVHGVPEGG